MYLYNVTIEILYEHRKKIWNISLITVDIVSILQVFIINKIYCKIRGIVKFCKSCGTNLNKTRETFVIKFVHLILGEL